MRVLTAGLEPVAGRVHLIVLAAMGRLKAIDTTSFSKQSPSVEWQQSMAGVLHQMCICSVYSADTALSLQISRHIRVDFAWMLHILQLA